MSFCVNDEFRFDSKHGWPIETGLKSVQRFEESLLVRTFTARSGCDSLTSGRFEMLIDLRCGKSDYNRFLFGFG